jgi:hypothetical protein
MLTVQGDRTAMAISRIHDDETDDLSEAELATALQQTPRGALALAALTVGLLMLAWLAIYLFVFLPRGEVG